MYATLIGSGVGFLSAATRQSLYARRFKADTVAARLGITAGARVLSTLEWCTLDGVAEGLLAVLAAGASLVQCRNADPAVLDRRAEAEKATVRLG